MFILSDNFNLRALNWSKMKIIMMILLYWNNKLFMLSDCEVVNVNDQNRWTNIMRNTVLAVCFWNHSKKSSFKITSFRYIYDCWSCKYKKNCSPHKTRSLGFCSSRSFSLFLVPSLYINSFFLWIFLIILIEFTLTLCALQIILCFLILEIYMKRRVKK